ncbi:hypothetical protein [Pseudactinotalea terrae]|uniref:hypothetical protein n=1 Tax=Pseudactinotalea terrae TaxID=1743262 RepID=UPI0012E25121|nr:hypothetical protein [Pseudactinotalea terrae]
MTAPAPVRFAPSWTTTTTGGKVTSLCGCGWSHTSADADLASIARVDHELRHRRRATEQAGLADLLDAGENPMPTVLGKLVATGLTRESALAAVHDAVDTRRVTITDRFALRRA